jgi:hypothetical protein
MLWRLSPGQSKRLLIDAPSCHVRDRVRESALVLRSTPMAAISGQIAVYNVLRSTETVLATHRGAYAVYSTAGWRDRETYAAGGRVSTHTEGSRGVQMENRYQFTAICAVWD